MSSRAELRCIRSRIHFVVGCVAGQVTGTSWIVISPFHMRVMSTLDSAVPGEGRKIRSTTFASNLSFAITNPPVLYCVGPLEEIGEIFHSRPSAARATMSKAGVAGSRRS
jgi:hypothetical protein